MKKVFYLSILSLAVSSGFSVNGMSGQQYQVTQQQTVRQQWQALIPDNLLRAWSPLTEADKRKVFPLLTQNQQALVMKQHQPQGVPHFCSPQPQVIQQQWQVLIPDDLLRAWSPLTEADKGKVFPLLTPDQQAVVMGQRQLQGVPQFRPPQPQMIRQQWQACPQSVPINGRRYIMDGSTIDAIERSSISIASINADIPSVIEAYEKISSPNISNLFASIDDPANTRAVATICNFIVKLKYRLEQENQAGGSLADGNLHWRISLPSSNTQNPLRYLLWGIDCMIYGDIQGSHDLKDCLMWSSLGLIAKVLNFSMDEDTRHKVFKKSCRLDTYPDIKLKLDPPNANQDIGSVFSNDVATYREQLQVINELLKTGLIHDIAMEIPIQHSDILFSTLKLNKNVNEVSFCGYLEPELFDATSPFNISKLLSLLEDAGDLTKMAFRDMLLTDETAFFDFIARHRVSCLWFNCVSSLNLGRFCNLLKQSAVSDFSSRANTFPSGRKQVHGLSELIRSLPHSLKKLSLDGIDCRFLQEKINIILRNSNTLEELILGSYTPRLRYRPSIDPISVPPHQSLLLVQVNGKVIWRRENR